MTLIPKPKGSGGARAATAQVGPANKRNDTKRCLLFEASLRPGEAVSPGQPQSAQQSQTQVFSPAAEPQVPRGDIMHCFYSHCDVINFWTLAPPALKGGKASDWLQPTRKPK